MPQLTRIARSIAVISSLTTLTVSAAGFQLNEHSANGLGRAFAGEAATVENASILARNPAAMSRFNSLSFSGQISYINPDINMKGTSTNHLGDTYNTVLAPTAELISGSSLARVETEYSAKADDVAPDAFIPSFYVIAPINDKFHIGLGAFSNFGLSTDYDSDFNALEYADKTEVTTININPNISYKVSDTLSVGIGFNAVYADGSIGTKTPAYMDDHAAAYAEYNTIAEMTGGVLPVLPVVPGNATIMYVEGDGWDYGWNVGLLWAPTPQTDIALTYRSAVSIDIEGTVSSDLLGLDKEAAKLPLDLPELAEVAVNHRVDDQWSIQASYHYTGWSSFDELVVIFDETTSIGDSIQLKEENFGNSWRAALGVTYVMSPELTLRAGYAYDSSPVKQEYRSISIPDTDRRWYSTGLTYNFDDKSSFDLGYSFLHGNSVKISEEFELQGTTVTTLDAQMDRANAHIFAAQYNYQF
ncbi:outer membrane protein transport protein [Neiella marina]|uniref:Outer membrane protein transport protein n=1 Tax=Neiella holothuriorum TaxID=2870530 RepID=A0ABS7EDP7_9GAMM|nr:outer membrane protein transport protein [Neiella holothuriorum]MBW8190441.1 outer membrane protein transport protein [Neiella holothuriorum]